MKALLFSIAALAVVMAGGPATAEDGVIRGTVAYRERMALPPNAQVEVTLVDVSRADAPADVVARAVFEAQGRQSPIAFELPYETAAIQPRARYALEARVTIDGRIEFRTAAYHPAFPAGGRPIELMLRRVRIRPEALAPETPTGRWLAERIAPGAVIDRAQTTLELTARGGVSGSGGCNRYFGKAEIDGDRIRFGKLGSTQMACPEALMEQERRFFGVLEEARSWIVDPLRRKLTLFDASGAPLATFSAM
ncbi:YbaY family lipoprotein [Methylocella sp.]|uniref:YbaY family lipoprotein n=1 Tax=Methylocella sp. TaxID=1978226 RepID=UPI00378377E6